MVIILCGVVGTQHTRGKIPENAFIVDVVHHNHVVLIVAVQLRVDVLHEVIALSILCNACEVYLAYRWTLLREQRSSILSPAVTQHNTAVMFNNLTHICTTPKSGV